MEELETQEQQHRVNIRLQENHLREEEHNEFDRVRLMDGTELLSVPIDLELQEEEVTVFDGPILTATIVSPTRGLSMYEKALLEMGSFDEVFSTRRRRHCDLEESIRLEITKEEGARHASLLTMSARSLNVLVDTIYNLPQDMIELQLCKLYDHERLEYRLRPAVRGEQFIRDHIVLFEIEEKMRLRHQFLENMTSLRLFSRFQDMLASIIAFTKATAIIRLGMETTSSIEHTYYHKWEVYSRTLSRDRRINVGLRRLQLQARRSLVRRYCQLWNGPNQLSQYTAEQDEITALYHEIRQEIVLSEEEVRDRSVFEAMEKGEFQALFDEHFDEFEPLSRARKESAAAELEMLNAARHTKWRLLCLYKHMVRVQGESKATFLSERTRQYAINRRLMCWLHWTERTSMVRSLIREHRTTSLQLREGTRRHGVEVHQTHIRHRLLTKARSPPVPYSEVVECEERSHLLTMRNHFTSWLYFISQNNPQAESAILESQTLRRMKLKYFKKILRFRKRRRDASAILMVRWGKLSNIISVQVDEFQRRIALEARQELTPLQYILVHRRKVELPNKVLPDYSTHLLRQRFHTLSAYRSQQQHRRYALDKTQARAKELLVTRYAIRWELFQTPRTAVSTMNKEAEVEEDTFTRLTLKYKEDTAYLKAEEKYQRATVLLSITNTILLSYAYGRFTGLVKRRNLARSKKSLTVTMATQLERLNIGQRYLHFWKKYCARRRLALLMAEKSMACSIDLIRRYYFNLRPPSIRRSKVCRAKKNLIAAREAAENTAVASQAYSGAAEGELAHVVLPLRRRNRLLPPL